MYDQRFLSDDSESLKSLHSESHLTSNSWKSFHHARLLRWLSLNKSLKIMKNMNENENEVKQEMKQEVK